MIISDSRQFIFTHVPKTGGTTAREALKRFDTRNDFFWLFHYISGASDDFPSLPIDKAHMTLSTMEILYPDVFKLYSKYTIIALARHPIARLVSSFFESQFPPSPESEDQTVFNEDIANRLGMQSLFDSYLDRIILGANFILPEYRYATPQHEYHLRNGKMITDIIIKIEDPSIGIRSLRCFDKLLADVLQGALSKNKLNQRPGIHGLGLWNATPDKLKADIIRLYIKDFELFGYNAADYCAS